ncbi:hypothetical protein [Vitreimonas sp.]|uniref:hypothetical protein n=1 Tax=Vitreimonas sp. TaxID=3069702 RepID=UPI002ED91C28
MAALFGDIRSLLQEMTPQNWITLIGFFSTPAIVVWVWPKLRGFYVAVGSTVACWLFGAIWNGASISIILIYTPVIAAVCALLCGAVLLARRAFPLRAPAEEGGATEK